MTEETPPPQPPPPPPPTYLEVHCKTSRKIHRFAAGTDAGSAVSVINTMLKKSNAHALHIEAVKEGEEPIAFGSNSVLVDYGDGWKLQTFNEADAENVIEALEPIAFGHNSVLVYYGDGRKLQIFNEADAEDVKHGDHFPPTPMPRPVSGGLRPKRKVSKPISLLYVVKILLAFIVIFVLGAIFTLFLENLPSLILYFKSLM